MSFGIDYAWTHPTIQSMLDKNVKFVMRYLSRASTKDLSKAEANALAMRGIWMGVVWETSAARATGTRTDGETDAMLALSKARTLGMPEDRPIYFAVDFDCRTGTEVLDYFRGVASVLGENRTGIYGGIIPIQYMASIGLAKWYWQTLAWSGGKWFVGNHIKQYAIEKKLDGADVDYNESMRPDFGQWMPGRSPVNVPATPATPKEENEVRYYGELYPGTGQVTAVSIHPTDVSTIGFFADPSLEGRGPVKLRVAVHDSKGFDVHNIELTKAKPKVWFRLRDPNTTDGFSVRREVYSEPGADNTGVLASVAWDAS